MLAFVGLGNPGNIYAETKHNAGFWVVDELARRWKISFKPGKGEFLYAESDDHSVLLVKPTTGMNVSGVAVKEVMQSWALDLQELFIVLDDVDLPLGKLRLRPKGGDGCHRGMESVIYHQGNTNFPRLRFGIATENKLRPAEKYVLKPFRKKDRVLANEMVVTAADAVESVLTRGIEKTMNVFNR